MADFDSRNYNTGADLNSYADWSNHHSADSNTNVYVMYNDGESNQQQEPLNNDPPASDQLDSPNGNSEKHVCCYCSQCTRYKYYDMDILDKICYERTHYYNDSFLSFLSVIIIFFFLMLMIIPFSIEQRHGLILIAFIALVGLWIGVFAVLYKKKQIKRPY